jgi:tight adherence protein C
MTLSTWLAIACTGVSVFCIAVLCWRLLSDPPAPAPLVEAPPGGFRLAWRPINAAGHYYAARLSWRTRRRIETELVQAGLRHALGAVQMAGAQVVCALAAMSVAGLSAWSLGVSATSSLVIAATAALGGWIYPRIWLRDRMRQRAAQARRALPFVLDMTTLCVEAGLNLGMALQQTAGKAPAGPLRDELRRVLGDIRTGVARAQALRDMAGRLDLPEVRSWVGALVQADTLGMSLAPILRAQSDQRRSERFLRAERLAMEAPVKMLFPLIACIFPCSFIVIGFPIAVQLLEVGG